MFVRHRVLVKPDLDVWMLHGLGESGLCYREAFYHDSLNKFSLYVPDFPGFGVSPICRGQEDIAHAADLILPVIKSLSRDNRISIVAHSMGAIVGTEVAERLGDQVKCMVNVEGNISRDGCFLSSKTCTITDATEYYNDFLESVFRNGPQDESLERYHASVRFCDPDALYAWARRGYELTGEERCGASYIRLKCPKLYIYGENSISPASRTFLNDNQLELVKFPNCGHWPMIQDPGRFYSEIANFIVRE